MPDWYFERKEIKNSSSLRDGIDTNTENRYRREGARFILDAGTKLGLHNDTCATGVVYFHRFYMFHSFKEFYRYVTAACCLFLAGKVEETPKKCRDIIKTAQALLSPASFQRFGEDPREEVMMMERILLKTIQFDLQIEHPYGFLMKYFKLFKGDKEKAQKMLQMAWTFINDSLCTTLCLQWEPEIISVSLMYLASRLSKFDPNEWSGRSSSRSKWWEDFVEGMSMELMEDICHQVLDLYSQKAKHKEVDSPPPSPVKKGDSPPPPPPPGGPADKPLGKRSREVTPIEPDSESKMKGAKIAKEVKPEATGAPIPVASNTGTHPSYPDETSQEDSYNPYMSSQMPQTMFSASFMSQEGSQNIQAILTGNPAPPPAPVQAYPAPHAPNPTSAPSQYAPPAEPQYAYPPPPQQPQQQQQQQQQQPYMPPQNLPPPHQPHPYPQPPNPQFDPYAMQQNQPYPPPPGAFPPPANQHQQQGGYPPPPAPPNQQGPYPPTTQPGNFPQQQYNYPPQYSNPNQQYAPQPGGGMPPQQGGPSYPPPTSFPSQPPQGPPQGQNFGGPHHRGNFNDQNNQNNQKHGNHKRNDIHADRR